MSGVEATGYSPNLSFDEALANANANMPPASLNPDQIDHRLVVDTGTLFGGLAGFHHLYVKIRRPT